MARERKVFIINEPKGNRLLLGKHGSVMQLCPGWIDNKDLAKNLEFLVKVLTDQHEDPDLVVFGGHAKLNMVAFHLILKRHGVLRQLLPTKQGWFQLMHDERAGEDGRPRANWFIPS